MENGWWNAGITVHVCVIQIVRHNYYWRLGRHASADPTPQNTQPPVCGVIVNLITCGSRERELLVRSRGGFNLRGETWIPAEIKLIFANSPNSRDMTESCNFKAYLRFIPIFDHTFAYNAVAKYLQSITLLLCIYTVISCSQRGLYPETFNIRNINIIELFLCNTWYIIVIYFHMNFTYLENTMSIIL